MKKLFFLAFIIFAFNIVTLAQAPGSAPAYPGALDTRGSFLTGSNNASSTLANLTGINAAAATLTVNSNPTLFPTTGGAITIDNEIIYYATRSGSILSGLLRGRDGTVAASHNFGATISMKIIAQHVNGHSDSIIEVQRKLGTGADVAAANEFLIGTGPGATAFSPLTSLHVTNALGFTPLTGSRLINTTAPLAGGGNLNADLTLSIVDASASVSGVVNTTTQSFAGPKTFTSPPTFVQTTENEPSWSDLGATKLIAGGADSSEASPTTSLNPSVVFQTTRNTATSGCSPGVDCPSIVGAAFRFIKKGGYHDNYGILATLRDSTNYSGYANAGYNLHGIGSLTISSGTNIPVGASVNLYGGWIRAGVFAPNINAYGLEADVNNASGANAPTVVGTKGQTFSFVTGFDGTNYNTGHWLLQGTAGLGGYFGMYAKSLSVVRAGINFADMTLSLTGSTWAANAASASVTISSGGEADVEIAQGDWPLINGVYARALSATANAITLTGTYGSFGGSGTPTGLTITKSATAMLLRINQPILVLNEAGNSYKEAFRMDELNRMRFDYDAMGSIYGGDVTISGLLKTGSSPTTLTDAAGKILAASLNLVTVPVGGTGATSFTSNGVLYGNGTSAIQVTAQGGANTILVANLGAPSFTAAPTIGISLTTPILYGGSAAGSTLTLNGTSGTAASPGAAYVSINPNVSGAFPGTVFIGAPTSSGGSASGISDVLHLQGTDTSTTLLTMDAYGVASFPALVFRAARGTSGSPLASASGDSIASFGGRPHDGTIFTTGNRAVIQFKAAQNITSSNQGMLISFETTPLNDTARKARGQFTANGSFYVGDGAAALATTATDGFIYIPTSAGTPTGVPTTILGVAATEFDTTNGKLKVYNDGWETINPVLETAYCITVSTALPVSGRTGDIFRAYGAQTQNDDSAIEIPAGKTLKIVSANLKAQTGASAGTYVIKLQLRNVTDNTYQDVVTISSAATSTIVTNRAVGTTATPIVSLAGSKRFTMVVLNDSTSPGALGTGAQMGTITYVIE